MKKGKKVRWNEWIKKAGTIYSLMIFNTSNTGKEEERKKRRKWMDEWRKEKKEMNKRKQEQYSLMIFYTSTTGKRVRK